MDVPFRVGETVYDEGHFMDRAREVARVRRAIRDRERLLVYGERRLGKSSVLRRSALREEKSSRAVVIWLDLWSLTTVGDMLRAVVSSIPWKWAPRERLVSLLAKADVRPTAVADPTTGELSLTLGWGVRDLSDPRARDLLRSTLESLSEVGADQKRPIIIVLDEFQQIERMTAHGGAYLRSIIQDTGHLGYLLAGSMLSLVNDLVGPKGPFYNIPRLDIGPIDDEEMAQWIESRMHDHRVTAAKNVGARIVELAGDSTEARVALAKESFVLGIGARTLGLPDVESAFQNVVGARASGYEIMWAGLTTAQRRALQVLGNGEDKPYSAAVLAKYGITSSSAMSRAVGSLRDQALLLSLDPPRIADPFFSAWVRAATSHSGRWRMGYPPPA